MRRLIPILLCLALIVSGQANAAFRPSTIGDVFHKGASGFDVRAYGALGDGSTDDAAAFTLAIAAAAGGRVIIPEAATSYRLSTNVTVPAGVTLDIQQGGPILIDTGVTLTVNGTIEAGGYQIFSLTGTGVATLAVGSCDYVLPQWWGAVGDDSTDCHDAIEAAITAAVNVGFVYIPSGTYRITAPIDNFAYGYSTTHNTGLVIAGASMGDTIIKYTGSSDYAIKLWHTDLATSIQSKAVHFVTIRDLRIEANSIGSAGGGGVAFKGSGWCTLERVAFENINTDYGTAVMLERRDYVLVEDSMTNDTNRDFTTSAGGGATEAYAIAFTTPAGSTNNLKSVIVRLAKTGAPAGTMTASIYTDSSGPDAIVTDSAASETVAVSSLVTDADGGDVTFTWLWKNAASLSASTKYWIVLETSGYTYTDTTTEIRLRVDAGDGGADAFGTFDDGGGGWSTSTDGSNTTVTIGKHLALLNYLRGVNILGSSPALVGVSVRDDSQVLISDSNLSAKTAFESNGSPLVKVDRTNLVGVGTMVINMTGGG